MGDDFSDREDTRRRARQPGGTQRRAHDEEAKMRAQYAREKEDANRQSIGNVRGEVMMVRQEMRSDLEKVSDASRERDKELHLKLDQRSEKFDDRLDNLKDAVTTVKTELTTLNRLMEKQAQGEFDDAPFYARPAYIKAMGLAIAAMLAAVLTSLGLVFGWGGGALPEHADPPAAEAPAAEAPADPGASQGD